MLRQFASCFVALFSITAIGYLSEGSRVDLDATPRITITYNELSSVSRFSGRVSNYSTLLLEDERGILYVGARGAIFSLNSSNISQRRQKAIHWEVTMRKQADCIDKGKNNQTECFNHIRLLLRFNETHLYVCGTNAFSPLCVYIDSRTFNVSSNVEDGKDKCPYDPARGYTGVIVDGTLNTATRYEFRSLPDIRRKTHQLLKTEESNLHWLNDAEFVSSALVRESTNIAIGDDDKIYYFFNEKVVEESSSFLDKTQVASVARVCKVETRWRRILQRKWTSFLRQDYVCYMPFYEILRSTYTLDIGTWTQLFSTGLSSCMKNMEASTICRYNISDIQKVFEGPYMEYQDSSRKWSRYEGEVPKPRPGSCITNELRNSGYNSSQDLPNFVLDFVKLHPLMYEKVYPIDKQPLMKKNLIYNRIAVDRVKALDNVHYDVLFLGTDNGWIHKAVVIKSSVHIIEEIQVFKDPQPIENLVISKKQNSLYIGAQSAVLQIPLSGCSQYHTCYDCILARNPYCGWDGDICREIHTVGNRARMTQDMQNGNGGCLNSTADDAPVKKVRTVLKGNDVLLQCDLRSNLARPQWWVNGSDQMEDGKGHIRLGVDGLLITDTLLEHNGEYSCYSVENGLQSLVATFSLNVLLELPKEKNYSTSTSVGQLPTPASLTASKMQFVYISIITILGGLCIVLCVILLYVSCQQKRKGIYAMRNSCSPHVELQTVSSHFKEKSDDMNSYNEMCLQIIPGEAPTSSPYKIAPPPPPPPPPLPSEFTNGISTLPNMLRKMNGNSYMLLRQNEETSLPSYNSFTEELSKILEKRKHTQLVEKLDESSV
ncbi:hypothetical protein GDO86_013350 [Hymenochirus boettgeri]|uniref:Semaphorin-4G n=1 Tax=Hymenochirus boettgeri TaxID=247094 RepID=A0A8T2IQZ4_9PIPI|nr:hypothetical protein GDO86_013350 [Hymenochirus boettgeri]